METDIPFEYLEYGINGEPEHNTDSVICWCAPTYDQERGIVVHRDMADILSAARALGQADCAEDQRSDRLEITRLLELVRATDAEKRGVEIGLRDLKAYLYIFQHEIKRLKAELDKALEDAKYWRRQRVVADHEAETKREKQRKAAARRVAQFARNNMAATEHVQRAQRERDGALKERDDWMYEARAWYRISERVREIAGQPGGLTVQAVEDLRAERDAARAEAARLLMTLNTIQASRAALAGHEGGQPAAQEGGQP